MLNELSHGEKVVDVSTVWRSKRRKARIYNVIQFSSHSYQLPKNNALSGLCNGMIEAWILQGKPRAAILFVIENVTYNICDQVSEPPQLALVRRLNVFFPFSIAFPRVLHPRESPGNKSAAQNAHPDPPAGQAGAEQRASDVSATGSCLSVYFRRNLNWNLYPQRWHWSVGRLLPRRLRARSLSDRKGVGSPLDGREVAGNQEPFDQLPLGRDEESSASARQAGSAGPLHHGRRQNQNGFGHLHWALRDGQQHRRRPESVRNGAHRPVAVSDSALASRCSTEQALMSDFRHSRFVLKPQREGGGNNVYGHDIPDALSVMNRPTKELIAEINISLSFK